MLILMLKFDILFAIRCRYKKKSYYAWEDKTFEQTVVVHCRGTFSVLLDNYLNY